MVLGLVLTAVDSWTSGTGLGKINLNILINFAFVRLLLPEVERRVMPHPWVVALLAMAIVLLIRPFQQILEYGAEGWLWALFGLSHRLALQAQHPQWVRDGLAAAAALVYTAKEILDHGFDGAESAVLAGLIAALTLALALFRRADLIPTRGLANSLGLPKSSRVKIDGGEGEIRHATGAYTSRGL